MQAHFKKCGRTFYHIFHKNSLRSPNQPFEEVFMNLLDHHAPLKKKILRANNAPYITKKLRKAIIKRSHFEKINWKSLTEKSLKVYKKQKNYVSRLHKKERKMFFNNLNQSVVSDNRKFWKTVKPLFSNIGNYVNKIKLVESEEIVDDDTIVAEQLNNFFKSAAASLDIHGDQYLLIYSFIYFLFI